MGQPTGPGAAGPEPDLVGRVPGLLCELRDRRRRIRCRRSRHVGNRRYDVSRHQVSRLDGTHGFDERARCRSRLSVRSLGHQLELRRATPGLRRPDLHGALHPRPLHHAVVGHRVVGLDRCGHGGRDLGRAGRFCAAILRLALRYPVRCDLRRSDRIVHASSSGEHDGAARRHVAARSPGRTGRWRRALPAHLRRVRHCSGATPAQRGLHGRHRGPDRVERVADVPGRTRPEGTAGRDGPAHELPRHTSAGRGGRGRNGDACVHPHGCSRFECGLTVTAGRRFPDGAVGTRGRHCAALRRLRLPGARRRHFPRKALEVEGRRGRRGCPGRDGPGRRREPGRVREGLVRRLGPPAARHPHLDAAGSRPRVLGLPSRPRLGPGEAASPQPDPQTQSSVDGGAVT